MTYPWSGQRQRPMTATPGEFVATLKAAFPALEVGETWLVVRQGEAGLRFDFQVGDSRRLGSLQLPSLLVTVTPLGGAPVALAALLEQVDRATQRGGG